MRHRKWTACLSGALSLIAVHQAWANTMRCGDRLIEVGDSMATVQALCGRPADVQHGFLVSATTARAGSGVRSTVGAEVPVETWNYNRGPNQFMVSIRFVDGKIAEIDTLHEYGH